MRDANPSASKSGVDETQVSTRMTVSSLFSLRWHYLRNSLGILSLHVSNLESPFRMIRIERWSEFTSFRERILHSLTNRSAIGLGQVMSTADLPRVENDIRLRWTRSMEAAQSSKRSPLALGALRSHATERTLKSPRTGCALCSSTEYFLSAVFTENDENILLLKVEE